MTDDVDRVIHRIGKRCFIFDYRDTPISHHCERDTGWCYIELADFLHTTNTFNSPFIVYMHIKRMICFQTKAPPSSQGA